MLRRSRGFTLLEVLIVMVLIGVLLALVVPVLSASSTQRARQHGHELLALLHELRERSVAEGREYGLHFDAQGYRTMVWREGNWQSLRAYPLPDGLQFRLVLEGQALPFSARTHAPQLLIMSSDEISAFSLHYETAQVRWLSIASDGVNDAAINES
ncbi:type II secretion system minor pseudopilin GspH [Pseudomonas sp. NPDC088368]|jgi:general secretion pathway protein H|uniref:type II secretion system minor pseudopilin GspH n=1 Tax=Pseudomonas sp. NPDC088368 TaxID=3364453 RepID=UPI0038087A34